MRRSAFISIALHLAILLWAVAVFPGGRALDAPPIRDVPIDIVTPSEFTKIKAGKVDAKDEAPMAPKPEPKKPVAVKEKQAPKPPKEEVALPPPPAPAAKPEPPQEPEPEKAEEPKKEEPKAAAVPEKPKPKPKPVKKAASKPKPKPKPAPPTENKSDFNTDRIAALLNKIPDAAPEQPSPLDAPPETLQKPVRGQSSGRESAMSVNEIDALRAKIAQCWSPPPGGLGADSIVVKLRLQLNEDGTLVGYPAVANSSSSPFFRAAADSAVRAVYQCQPYELPREKFSLWRDMILNFDPSQMYGSG